MTGAVDRRIHALPDEYFRDRSDEADWAGQYQTVDSRGDLSYDEFVRDYVRKKRPIVIKNGVRADAITPITLRAFYGHASLSDLQGGGGSRVLVRGRESSIERFKSLRTLGEYLTCFEDEAAGLPYLTNLNIPINFPDLLDAFAPPPYLEPNWITRRPFSAMGFENSGRIGAEVFIAPVGATYGVLHYDRHAVYVGTCQYFGKKLWWLCAPEQSLYLYPNTGGYPHMSRVNPFDADVKTFPLFERARPLVVTLEPGDVMFVPDSWWHATKAVTPNISTVYRIINRHNLWAHLWDLRYYVRHEPAVIAVALTRLLSRRRR